MMQAAHLLRRLVWRGLLFVVLVALPLAACAGQVPAPTATPSDSPVPPSATPVPPTATALPPTATPVPPTATPEPVASYKGAPQGRDESGAATLGAADAPVVLTDYSDFL